MALNTTVLFILGVLFDLIAIFILIGNVLIIIAVYRFRRLQTITNRFVVSLACSDFLAGLFISWQSAFNYNPSLDNVAITCISRLIQIQPSYCSVLHLLAIAIDRYLAVLHPLRYHDFMTARVSNIMIALSWIFSTFLTSLIIGTSRFELGVTQCMLNDIVPNGVLIFVLQVTFTSVMLCMLYLYARIFWVAKRQMKQINALMVMTADNPKKLGMKQELKAAKQLAFIVLVFVCCHAMFYIITTMGYFYEALGIPGEKFLIYYKISILIIFFNAFMNPIVYALKSKEFKEAFKRILCRHRTPEGQNENSLRIDDSSSATRTTTVTRKTNKFAEKVREHSVNGDLAIVNI